MTTIYDPRADIESKVLGSYMDGVPGFLHVLVSRMRSGEIEERTGRFQTMYDFCANEAERQKAAGLDAKVSVMGDGSSHCYGTVVLEEKVDCWRDVEGWFKPPKSCYQSGAFGYEMDGGESWRAYCKNGASIVVSKPQDGGAGHIMSVSAHPKYFADAMKVAVMLVGTALNSS